MLDDFKKEPGRIAYSRNTSEIVVKSLHSVDDDLKDRVYAIPGGNISEVVWSADGQSIFYVNQDTYWSEQIIKYDLSGCKSQILLDLKDYKKLGLDHAVIVELRHDDKNLLFRQSSSDKWYSIAESGGAVKSEPTARGNSQNMIDNGKYVLESTPQSMIKGQGLEIRIGAGNRPVYTPTDYEMVAEKR